MVPSSSSLRADRLNAMYPGIPETVADDHGLISQFQEDGTGLLFQYPHPVNGGHATPPDFRETRV